MNEQTPNKRKDIIKNIAIVFLSVLLLLTFFSNTIMNYSLPQVSYVYPAQASVSEQIKGSGTIEPAETYEVKSQSTREIKAVMVSQGDQVKAGDVIFELESSEPTELTDAEKELENLQFAYRKALVTSTTNYDKDIAAIDKAEGELRILKNELSDLQAQYESAHNKTDALSVASADVKELKAEGDRLAREKEDLKNRLASVDTDDMLDLTGTDYDRLFAAKQAVKDAEKAQTEADNAYTKKSTELSGKTDKSSEILSKQNEVYSLQNKNNQLYNAIGEAGPDDDVTSYRNSIADNNTTISNLSREIAELYNNNIESKQAQNTLKQYEKKKDDAAKKVTAAKEALADLTREIKLSLKKQINDIDEKIRANTEAQDKATEKKTDAEASGLQTESKLKELIRDKEKEITTKESSINDLRIDLAAKQKTDASTAQTNQIDLESKQREIERQQAKIEKIKKDNEGEQVIRSKVNGTVDSLNITVGQKIEAGSTLARINVTEMGYKLQFSVKADQARKVRVGDKAEITGWYFGGDDVEITLKEIKSDSGSQGQKLLVFSVTGSNITSGDTLSVGLGSKGQTYPQVLPNNAVRHDENGDYVLVMEAKSSPLGNRYVAVRYDIQKIVSNDTKTAVSGLTGSEYVITTASKPIRIGQNVRPSETS
ncbi:MAG: biotin/lipoyl-binding protein [Oscillospiraceae bacterium]|nr:biotin/lipoyl-binding protein [Oscillospiraceae bacterium]